MIIRSSAALLLLTTCLGAFGDVVIPGHINKQFLIANLDKFPAFKFAFKHYSFHYDLGYQANPADTVMMENNTRYFISNKGSQKEAIMARDSSGTYFFSDRKLGGSAEVSTSINGIVEVYNIISIKKGKINLKKTKEIVLYANGKEKERRASSELAGLIGSDGFSSGLVIISTGALLGLLTLFLFRKRKPKFIQLTA